MASKSREAAWVAEAGRRLAGTRRALGLAQEKKLVAAIGCGRAALGAAGAQLADAGVRPRVCGAACELGP